MQDEHSAGTTLKLAKANEGAFPSYNRYSGTPLNGHPSTVESHDITDSGNSETPNCPSIHF